MRPYDPRLPWIQYEYYQQGFVVVDLRTGERAYAPDAHALARFAAEHSSTPGYGGLGDAVHAVTSRLGMTPCTPCEARRAAMNGFLPRLFRRR